MYAVLKEKFKQTGQVVLGQPIEGHLDIVVDRYVNSLEDVKKGEIYFKCKIKK